MNPSTHLYNDFKLFVGNMPGDVSADEISAVFSKFGQVFEVHIMSGNRSRSGQSSAFVKFTSYDACHEAIAAFHMKGKIRPTDNDFLSVRFAKLSPSPTRGPSPEPQIIGAVFEPKHSPQGTCLVSLETSTTASSTPASTPMASPTYRQMPHTGLTKLFVGGLPAYVDRDDLIAIFAPFGKVESVHLMNNNKSKSGQSCGFINYFHRNEALRAMEQLGGKYVVDGDLPAVTVRLADNPEEGAAKRQKLVLGCAEDFAKKVAQQVALEILNT
jgi:RNA recognition motif-containing protein